MSSRLQRLDCSRSGVKAKGKNLPDILYRLTLTCTALFNFSCDDGRHVDEPVSLVASESAPSRAKA